MSKIIVEESGPLSGRVRVGGSKNSALPLMAASILCEGECALHDVPRLSDTTNMRLLLETMGVKTSEIENGITIDPSGLNSQAPEYNLVNKLRASFLVMGPTLAKTGHTRISLPGGCAIGTRPVDLHLKGFAAMGAKITQGHGYVEAQAKRLKGAKIYLDFPSVGATENILMAACLASGESVIENVAAEPEIIDLSNFLCEMGAEIIGAGSDTIRVNGVKSLKPCEHRVIPDRIEAGTFMTIAAMTKGNIKVDNVIPSHLKPVTAKLKEMGIEVKEEEKSITVNGFGKFKAADIKTLPFPGFPTDMQAQFSALMSVIDGTAIITETIFENRFMHIGELIRMGANAKIEGRTAVIEGRKRLQGAQVKATDLRAGAALVAAGLMAEGVTEIDNAEHIYRGYDGLADKLKELGAKIHEQNF